VDDAAITAKVKAKFLKDSTVSGLKIDVDTRSGVIYLTGDNMNSQGAIDQAMKLTKVTDGVNRVVSKLAVVTSRARNNDRTAPAFSRRMSSC
jgi:hyperosmotically inducible protein